MARDTHPLLVQTGGKLFLYTDKTIDDYEATKGYITSRPAPGKPLSKRDCLWLATALLNHATKGV